MGPVASAVESAVETTCALCTHPVHPDTDAVLWVPAVDTPVHGECLEVMLLAMARDTA